MACKAQERATELRSLHVCPDKCSGSMENAGQGIFSPFLLPLPCLPGIELIKEKRWAFQRALPLPAAALYTNWQEWPHAGLLFST